MVTGGSASRGLASPGRVGSLAEAIGIILRKAMTALMDVPVGVRWAVRGMIADKLVLPDYR